MSRSSEYRLQKRKYDAMQKAQRDELGAPVINIKVHSGNEQAFAAYTVNNQFFEPDNKESASRSRESRFSQDVISDLIPVNGSASTVMNPILYRNVISNEYFRSLESMTEFDDLYEEINTNVTHVLPWQSEATRAPSSAFCILVRLMQLNLTYEQMKSLLQSDEDSDPSAIYCKAIGLLYLRYMAIPSTLYQWVEIFFRDDEEFSNNVMVQKAEIMNVERVRLNEFAMGLLSSPTYHGTQLPRIPVLIEKKHEILLKIARDQMHRRRQNVIRREEEDCFENGRKVLALYVDANTEPAWFNGTIASRDQSDPDGYWIKFNDYDGEILVNIGDISVSK
jgi:hypothetical protein